jgi:probable O-glycosylation ligase (exosortase A-associated)
MLRTIAVLLITVFGIAMSIKDAFWGLLLYTWYSFFSPLELTYGILAESRLSFIVAIVLIFTALLQGKALFKASTVTFLVIIFCIIAMASLAVKGTYNLQDVIRETLTLNKLAVMAIFAPVLITNVARLKLYVLAIVVSVGFLASYYGVFGLFAGSTFITGAGRIGDNNFYALVLVATLPLVPLCIKYANYKTLKLGLIFVVFGMLLALILTYSRGGFLGLLFVVAFWLLFLRKRWLITVVSLLVISYLTLSSFGYIRDFNRYDFESDFGASSVASQTLDDYLVRLLTLTSNPEETESGRSRLHFWKVAVLMANDRPLSGTGLNRFSLDYQSYDYSNGEFGGARAVHSTPMLILAELGYLGAIAFFVLITSCYIILIKARRSLKKMTDLKDGIYLRDLASTIMIAFVGFMVAGSFVIGLYVEIFWSLISLTIMCELLTKQIINEDFTNNSLPSISA